MSDDAAADPHDAPRDDAHPTAAPGAADAGPDHAAGTHANGTDELPFIGRPARDALAVIGVTRASQCRDYTERELLALHGVGPKAIRLLREAGVRLKD